MRVSVKLSFSCAAAMLALAGCAVDPLLVSPGMDRDAVLGRLGEPTGRYALADGERLQYSAQPSGGRVVNVDVGREGKVTAVQQTLDETRFGVIQPGAWHQADVLRQFGRPALVGHVALFRGDIWSYRYQSQGAMRMLHIFMDERGVVQRYQMTDEPFREPHS